jgi:hypothetical protein
MKGPDWLKRAAQRSVEEPWMLGRAFARYRAMEGYSSERLADELGCTVESLQWLSLCRRPEGESFAENVLTIAKRFALDPLRLSAVLRRVEVMDALFPPQTDREGAAGNPLLLAAQDRSEDEETSS